MELLRRLSLSAGNEDYFEQISDDKLKTLVDLLSSNHLETKVACLEIFYTIADK
jgi:hypothetical protein